MKRSYPLLTPRHLGAAQKLAASQATPALRKSARDAIARRYPGVKSGGVKSGGDKAGQPPSPQETSK